MSHGCIIERMGYKSNRHALRLAACKYHVVFCPKYRRKVLVDGVDKRLKAIIYQVAKELGCDARRCSYPLRSRPSIWSA
jgi:hypothetical protein